MSEIIINENKIGAIRKLHGVNCAPYSKASGPSQPLTDKIFTYCGIPYSRLHDAVGIFGGCHFIDVPNIFKNFGADENNPESYDFHYSDEYIASIVKTGAQIIYRLGITIEWGTKKYTVAPPRDMAKWARICEHIVRHYNEGWNNGFHYNIEYWEIWNEPENPPMWSGTREQFYQLYETASKHLKEKFPGIKIGGYGSCGFYAVFREGLSDFYKSFIPYFEDFLKMCREKSCPLDFFSWHIYTDKVEEIEKSQRYVRSTLDSFGFCSCESHLNEWNIGTEGQGFADMETMTGASFCCAALITMQLCGCDIGNYYVLSVTSRYNGFINLRTQELSPVPHVFAAFNKLFLASGELDVSAAADAPYALAASDGGVTVMLLSSYNKSAGVHTLKSESLDGKKIKLYKLTDKDGFVLVDNSIISGIYAIDCDSTSVYYAVIGDKGADSFGRYEF